MMDARTRELLRIFYAGADAHARGFGLMVNPYARRTKERAMWQSGWCLADRRTR